MKTDVFSVEEVLKDSRCFLVPIYQRIFRWDSKKLVPFWNDIEAKATEFLHEESRFSHYLGALILKPESGKASNCFDT